jgi:hypothetical protein
MRHHSCLKRVFFWGSFYVFCDYASRDAITQQLKYPSYALDTWKEGFNGGKLLTDLGVYSKTVFY